MLSFCHLAVLLSLGFAPRVQAVDVERADGSTRAAELATLTPADFGPGGVISIRFRREEPVPAGDGEVATAAGLDGEVTLIGGDRIAGVVRGGAGETLELRLAGTVPLPISIEELDHLVFPTRIPAGRALLHAEFGDRLYVRRGAELDRVDGTFESFGDEGVTFDATELGGSKAFAWSEVAALFVEALEGDVTATEDGTRTPVALDLVDGSRLRGGLATLTDDVCGIELAGGQAIDLPTALVREVTLDDGSIAFLSDLEPVAARAGSVFDDEFGMRWPHEKDRAVSGELLRAGGRTWSRGLGVHAGSLVVWELDGGWQTLRGSVAIDDGVLRLPGGAEASVEFRIWLDQEPGDGEPAWSSGTVRAGGVPLSIDPLDLAGVRTIALEVDPADNLSVGDRANWLRMLLVRG